MIDAKQVLHVARLARLELAPEDVQPMANELSSILGHIETMAERHRRLDDRRSILVAQHDDIRVSPLIALSRIGGSERHIVHRHLKPGVDQCVDRRRACENQRIGDEGNGLGHGRLW